MPIRDTNLYPSMVAGQEQGIRNALVQRETQKEDRTNALMADLVGSSPEQKDLILNSLLANDPQAASNYLGVQQQRQAVDYERQARDAQMQLSMSEAVRTSSDMRAMFDFLDDDGSARQLGSDLGYDMDTEEGILGTLNLMDSRARMALPVAEPSSLQEKIDTVQANINRELTPEEIVAMGGGGGGTTINVGGEGDKPLSITDLGRLQLPDGSAPPIGMTPNQARELGARIVSTEERSQQVKVEAANAVLDNLESLAIGDDENPGIFASAANGEGLIDRMRAAGSNALNMLTQDDPRISLYRDMSVGSLAPIVKALGESGALADGDIARATGLFPKLWPLPDTQEVAEAKFSALRVLLERGEANQRAIAEGREPDLSPIITDELLDSFSASAAAAGNAARNAAETVIDFSRMGVSELRDLDFDAMTQRQREAIAKRLDELGL